MDDSREESKERNAIVNCEVKKGIRRAGLSEVRFVR